MFQTFSVQKQTESCISNTMTTAEVQMPEDILPYCVSLSLYVGQCT